MNNITKTLLAGAAIGALGTAPALASHAPKLSLASSTVKTMAPGGVVGIHSKTSIADPHNGNNTSTFFFTIAEAYTLAESSWLNNTFFTGGWTFVSSLGGTTCVDDGGHMKVGKAKHGVTGKFTTSLTVTCSGDGISVVGPVYFPTYKLTSSTATKDKFTGKLVLKSNGNKYVLKLPIKIKITH